MKTRSKIWLWLHRKPASKRSVHFTIYLSAMMTGWFALLTLMFLTFLIVKPVWVLVSDTELILAMIGSVIFTYIMYHFDYRRDFRQGYIDAMYEQYLKRRDEEIARIKDE